MTPQVAGRSRPAARLFRTLPSMRLYVIGCPGEVAKREAGPARRATCRAKGALHEESERSGCNICGLMAMVRGVMGTTLDRRADTHVTGSLSLAAGAAWKLPAWPKCPPATTVCALSGDVQLFMRSTGVIKVHEKVPPQRWRPWKWSSVVPHRPGTHKYSTMGGTRPRVGPRAPAGLDLPRFLLQYMFTRLCCALFMEQRRRRSSFTGLAGPSRLFCHQPPPQQGVHSGSALAEPRYLEQCMDTA